MINNGVDGSLLNTRVSIILPTEKIPKRPSDVFRNIRFRILLPLLLLLFLLLPILPLPLPLSRIARRSRIRIHPC